jgi:hypothetical protein
LGGISGARSLSARSSASLSHSLRLMSLLPDGPRDRPADLLRSELEATAAIVFDQALPGGVEPGPDDSRSYAAWLGQRPATGSDDD